MGRPRAWGLDKEVDLTDSLSASSRDWERKWVLGAESFLRFGIRMMPFSDEIVCEKESLFACVFVPRACKEGSRYRVSTTQKTKERSAHVHIKSGFLARTE